MNPRAKRNRDFILFSFACSLLPFSPAQAATITNYPISEIFGVSHPQQIIDFDVASPRPDIHLADQNGVEVPSQVLAGGAKIAVETNLPANTSKTWQLMTGTPSVLPPNPVVLTQPPGTNYYQITNGKTGVRVYFANGQVRTIPIQSIQVVGNKATVITSVNHNLETGRSNDLQIGGVLATTNLTVTLSGLVNCSALNGQTFTYSEPGQGSPSRTQIIINNAGIPNCNDANVGILTVPEERMAPIQGIQLKDCTWTATGPNLLQTGDNAYVLNLGTLQTRILENGPLKVTVQVTYNFSSLGIYYGVQIEPPGAAHFTETITLEADQPSILVDDDTNYQLQYFLNFFNEVNPDQARFRAAAGHITNTEFGHAQDGSAFTCGSNAPTCDAFREFPVNEPVIASYVTGEYGTYQGLQLMSQWNLWPYNNGIYWMIYNKEAADGPVVGMFPNRASTAMGDNMTGVGVYSSPNPPAQFGFNFQSLRRGADGSVFPQSHYSWGIFVGTKSGDLGDPMTTQTIGLQMNLHGGINLNKVHRYDVNFDDSAKSYASLYMQGAALTSLIQQVRSDPLGPNGRGILGYLYQNDSADRPLFDMWRDQTEAKTIAEANQITSTVQSMLNDYVNGSGIVGTNQYWLGGNQMEGLGIFINSILADPQSPPASKTAAKAAAVAFANILWDNDFVPMNFGGPPTGNGLNAGTSNMPVQQESYRGFYALFLPNLSGLNDSLNQIVQDVIGSLAGLINASGAEISSTHYQEASISTTLDTLMQIQQAGLQDPFATQPSLTNYAHFNLQQMTPPEVRYGGLRKTVSIGDGSTESEFIPGKLATAFSASNSTLSQQLMWAWQQSGKSFSDWPGIGGALMVNQQLPAQDPQLGDGNFSGYFSILRHGWGTPDESANWLINGDWYQDHRHDDRGDVVLYALEAPLTVNWGSFYSPSSGAGNMLSTVIPASNYAAVIPWNQDNQPTDSIFSGWSQSSNSLFASFTYSSVADAKMTGNGGAQWTRKLYTLHHQAGLPIIMIRDDVSGIPGGGAVVRSMNFMSQGAIQTPAGPITPTARLDTDTAETPDNCQGADACPSVSATQTLQPGLNHFSFTGQTWKAHPTKGIDWDFYELSTGVEQFVLGNWGHVWNPGAEAGQFQQANGSPFQETQDMLRIAGPGPFTAIILPNRKGQLPSDRTVIQQGSGVLITQNGATWYVDSNSSYYKDSKTNVLTSYSASDVKGDSLAISGGPTEIQLKNNQITLTVHGAAGTRILTLPGKWNPQNGFKNLDNGQSQLNYAGGDPLTLVLQLAPDSPPVVPQPPTSPVTWTPPVLNWPSFLPMNGTLNINYGNLPVAKVEWDFSPIENAGSSSASQALGFRAQGTASYTTTSGAMSPSQLGVTLGTYQVTVKLIDSNGVVQATAGPQSVTFVNADLSGVKVYPNPWRSDKHAGKSVTFAGLTVGTTIKLFSVAGREAKELHTDGPTMQWDLTNDSGDKVASGVYLYLITDSLGDKVRGKVAVIR